MKIRELRKEYLTAQAFSYITSGLFLISYANTTQLRGFILGVGIFLCAVSFIDLIVLTFLPKRILNMEIIDSYCKIAILPLTFIAIFLSITGTRDLGFLEFRLIIYLLWCLLAIISMGVSGYKVISKRIKADTGQRGSLYRVFVYLAVLTLAMGYFLIIYGFYYPESVKTLVHFNKWLYNPWVWFSVTILCVFPILMLTPKDNDKD